MANIWIALSGVVAIQIILDNLEQKGELIAIDKDHEAINSAK